jgi:nucleoside-diphosphate-sugar epimerase
MPITSLPVLVTGANGFIVIHCIVQLLEQGYHVRGTLQTAIRLRMIEQGHM